MRKNIDVQNLPRYKSHEYFTKFECTWKEEKSDVIKKFKKDGELTAETEVYIQEEKLDRDIYWDRPTLKGTETVHLGTIKPTDGFLEFMDKFLEKKGLLFFKYWLTTYGTIVSICKLCGQDSDEFRKLVKKAESISELLAVSAFQD